MRKIILVCYVFAFCLIPADAFAVINGKNADHILPQVVLIENYERSQIGTGVLVGRDVILTAEHCVLASNVLALKIGGTSPLQVIFPDAEPESKSSPRLDLALVRINPALGFAQSVEPLKIDLRGALVKGDPISIVGYGLAIGPNLPLAIDQSVQKRIGKNVIEMLNDFYLRIYHPPGVHNETMPSGAAPGDSGGPMLDRNGAVVGIASTSVGGSSNYVNLAGAKARRFFKKAIELGWDVRIH